MDQFVGVVCAVGMLLMTLIAVAAIVRWLAWRDDAPPGNMSSRGDSY
jgi:hypothetical protein